MLATRPLMNQFFVPFLVSFNLLLCILGVQEFIFKKHDVPFRNGWRQGEIILDHLKCQKESTWILVQYIGDTNQLEVELHVEICFGLQFKSQASRGDRYCPGKMSMCQNIRIEHFWGNLNLLAFLVWTKLWIKRVQSADDDNDDNDDDVHLGMLRSTARVREVTTYWAKVAPGLLDRRRYWVGRHRACSWWWYWANVTGEGETDFYYKNFLVLLHDIG